MTQYKYFSQEAMLLFNMSSGWSYMIPGIRSMMSFIIMVLLVITEISLMVMLPSPGNGFSRAVTCTMRRLVHILASCR